MISFYISFKIVSGNIIKKKWNQMEYLHLRPFKVVWNVMPYISRISEMYFKILILYLFCPVQYTLIVTKVIWQLLINMTMNSSLWIFSQRQSTLLCKTEQLVLLLIGCVSPRARCDWTARLSRNGSHHQVSWRRGLRLILSHSLTAARARRMEATEAVGETRLSYFSLKSG